MTFAVHREKRLPFPPPPPSPLLLFVAQRDDEQVGILMDLYTRCFTLQVVELDAKCTLFGALGDDRFPFSTSSQNLDGSPITKVIRYYKQHHDITKLLGAKVSWEKLLNTADYNLPND